MRARSPSAIGLVAASLLGGCGGDERAPAPPAPTSTAAGNAGRAQIGPYPRSQFIIAHDLFLAADEPRTVPAAEAGFLRDDDEVYGIVAGERARAYAISMLAYHHVINDVMAGTPVAVTY